MKTAIIFGVSGQDGAFLSDLLLKKNYRIIGVSRNIHETSFDKLNKLNIRNKIELVSSPIHEYKRVLQLINDYEPDEIYNLAGQSSVALSFEMPFETFESISIANLNLLEAIRILKMPVKLYNAGSSDCFGNTNGTAATENTPLKPRSPYGVAKSAAYWQVANYREAYNIFACTGILFNHESHLRPKRFVTRKIVSTACRISKGSREKLLLGNISIERDWGWAPEYVEAMWLILQQEKPDDYIIATGKSYTLEYFISAVFKSLNMDWRDHVKLEKSLLRPTDIQTIRADPGKAKRVLDWEASFNTDDVARLMVKAELNEM